VKFRNEISLFNKSTCRENMLQDMGLAVKDDGITVGVFSPKKVFPR
jgi:Kinesin-associated